MRGANLKLQGQFKFDLYRPDGSLIKSSEYVDNFITNSGVMYPYHFAFADCFRYLSVGDGTTQNSINTAGPFPTTGLSSAIPAYSYIGGRVAFDSGKDGTYYTKPGDFGGGCGYINNRDGISLIRQWILPDNSGGVFTTSTTFHEFMVSPGRPYVTGLGGVKFCSCAEYDSEATGLDCSSTAEYYNWLSDKYRTNNSSQRLKTCDATKAFARVLYDLTAESGSILAVTYKLNVIVDTGVNAKTVFYHRADANPNWNNNLTSYSSITQPGVMLINDGSIYGAIAPNSNQRLQHFDYDAGRVYNFDNEYGESFVPPLGAPLEPSSFFLLNDASNQNLSVYLSNDNTQFLVNANGGAFDDTGHNAPWNLWETGDILNFYSSGDIVSSGITSYKYINLSSESGHELDDTDYWIDLGIFKEVKVNASGVMPFRNENEQAMLSGGTYWFLRPNGYNIRRNSGTAPSSTDVATNSDMTARYYTAPKASLPTFLFSCPATGTRNASVIYSYSFENFRDSTPLYAKSFVAAYKDLSYGTAFGLGDKNNLVPFFDSLISGISGNVTDVFVPGVTTGDTIVAGGTGAILSGDNSIEYNSLENLTSSLYPIINTSLTWSVPCPNGVYGC